MTDRPAHPIRRWISYFAGYCFGLYYGLRDIREAFRKGRHGI